MSRTVLKVKIENHMYPIVTVIMPCYNMAGTIKDSVESVLSSTLKDLEIVIVDDGSKDGSLGIIEGLARNDDRIRYVHQENQGVSVARNTALELAKGRYIFPLDADDQLCPSFLEKAVRILDERPDVKVVVPRGVFFGGRQGEWRLPDFSLSLLARKNMIPALSLYRKEDGLNIGGYSKEIIAREDWEFWIRMLKDGGEVVKIWDETGLRYRISKNSKRERDREYMRLVIDYLNLHHADFLKRELGGPLRYHRSWSKLINRIVALFPKRLSSWLSRFSISLLETEIFENLLDFGEESNALQDLLLDDVLFIL